MDLRFIVSDELGVDVARQLAVRKKLEQYVSEINGFYGDSRVDLQARIVEVAFSRIIALDAVDILQEMAREGHGFAGMFQRADELGADYTIAVMKKLMLRGKPNCGRGYAVNQTLEAISSTRKAFAVVNLGCGSHTLAHELGHLMGLNHGSLVDLCQPGMGHTSAIAPYANGYGVGNCDGKPQPGEFGTIMVGGWMGRIMGNDRASVRLFSNPLLRDERCGANRICGDPAIGDEARALNEHARYYVAHEEPDVQTLSYGSPQLGGCIHEKYHGQEIAELEELSCPGAAIKTLVGIEQLTSLKRIDLADNALEEVDSLLLLPADWVERIDLRHNSRIPCQARKRLAERFHDKVILLDGC